MAREWAWVSLTPHRQIILVCTSGRLASALARRRARYPRRRAPTSFGGRARSLRSLQKHGRSGSRRLARAILQRSPPPGIKTFWSSRATGKRKGTVVTPARDVARGFGSRWNSINAAQRRGLGSLCAFPSGRDGAHSRLVWLLGAGPLCLPSVRWNCAFLSGRVPPVPRPRLF